MLAFQPLSTSLPRFLVRSHTLLGCLLLWGCLASLTAAQPATAPPQQRLAEQFEADILPLVRQFCSDCHAGPTPDAGLDLSGYRQLPEVAEAHAIWEVVLQRVAAREMPPSDAETAMSDEQRQQMLDWLATFLRAEAERTAGDPGPVLARRLSNAEYDNCIRDLTGVDIRPTRDFPVDPANAAGFDNSGESLSMSPALLAKYLSAAREVSEHMVLTPAGIAFAPHPVATDTDRDKYCVKRIVEFYQRQPTDLAEYFYAAWLLKHAQASESLSHIAQQRGVSPRYLQLLWETLRDPPHTTGPWQTLLKKWHSLPAPSDSSTGVRELCQQLSQEVWRMRRSFEPQFANLTAEGIHKGAQPFVLWKNEQYANHRRTADLSHWTFSSPTGAAREAEEAACHHFCQLFPDAFYISERGRDYLDKPRDEQEKGRLLSAGFHSMMGYFRDDRPLMELILDEAGQQELDQLWRELDFFTAAPLRQYQGFLWFERTDSRTMRDPEFDFARPEDQASLTEPMIERLAQLYYAKAQRLGAGDTQLAAIDKYFRDINSQIRWVETARLAAEQSQLDALVDLAARATRRPLSASEQQAWRDFYQSLRDTEQLSHAEALQDLLVAILMSPNFCYRLDLLHTAPQPQPLDDFELASRLSFFLWASQPDAALLERAASGQLRQRDVLLAETRRLLADPKVRGLATEFAANWLDIRRFEEHNSVDRERFSSFTDELRSAMFEEPLRLFIDVVERDASLLDLLYADRTLVNRSLAQHYGMHDLQFDGEESWIVVEQASRWGRGGLLPMAVFLTKNAPGLRTSPVKRGYWVVRRLLGERIPPPPPNVPELPNDEAQLGQLTLREALAQHRAHPSCAGCHQRIDSIGLVFESYGPIGELRTKDLGGRPVETQAEFPDGSRRQSVSDLQAYIREVREEDFLGNFQRKLLSYALSRSLQLSDTKLLETLQTTAAEHDQRISSLIEAIVTSPQFLNKGSAYVPSQQPH